MSFGPEVSAIHDLDFMRENNISLEVVTGRLKTDGRWVSLINESTRCERIGVFEPGMVLRKRSTTHKQSILNVNSPYQVKRVQREQSVDSSIQFPKFPVKLINCSGEAVVVPQNKLLGTTELVSIEDKEIREYDSPASFREKIQETGASRQAIRDLENKFQPTGNVANGECSGRPATTPHNSASHTESQHTESYRFYQEPEQRA
ncbi:hypothetical protein ANN_19155 [Periplaneta americana]|uniref:Uncharacterized protein n=1 Tax=Periplaneta americana TaxID=6978 RepID=A0ABQ8SA04_PERAM|nr:hypothetical protein ANN_19155 [Periplaneta americana]